jgi:hypothetical protein
MNILKKSELILKGYHEKLGDGYPLLPQCLKRNLNSDTQQ